MCNTCQYKKKKRKAKLRQREMTDRQELEDRWEVAEAFYREKGRPSEPEGLALSDAEMQVIVGLMQVMATQDVAESLEKVKEAVRYTRVV